MAARLDPATRTAAIAAAVEEPSDLLVIGGGVVGCGIALDAAARGLDVTLLERDDLAAGASGASSRLVHGGVRYLERLELALIREALHERALLLTRTAPHLVRPLRFLYPFERRREAAYVGAGLTLYDALAGRQRRLPRHRRRGRAALRGLAPRFAGALEYWDACVDDAALTVALARTAAGLGVRVATRVEAVALVCEQDRVAGVRAVDKLTGAELEVRARTVVAAAGAEAEAVQRLATDRPPVRLRPSKGVHLLVPRERIDADAAVIARTAESVLFLIPWHEHWLVGTTDAPWEGVGMRPTATSEDVEYLLAEANRVLVRPLRTDDVVATYAGVRPLVDGNANGTAKLSREHVVARVADGFFVVAGGKLTTYRVTASDAVDAVAPGTHSRTAGLRLAEAERRETLEERARYAVSHEGALEPEDVLVRRLRLLDADRETSELVQRVVADELARYDSTTRSANSTARRSISSLS
jgi:glycerol-3-phosphate dehydrogenase